MKKLIMVLADGFEDIEAVTPIDVLRRAGVDVVLAGVSGTEITSAHGIKVTTDVALDDVNDLPDAIFLPGGMPGSKNLANSKKVAELIEKMHGKKKLISAICAAPALALARTGVLDGKTATCYPGFENNFSDAVTFSEDRVVVDGNVMTSRGPGSAMEFSLELVKYLVSKEKADQLREGLLVQ